MITTLSQLLNQLNILYFLVSRYHFGQNIYIFVESLEFVFESY